MRSAAHSPFPRWLGYGTTLLAIAALVATLLHATYGLTLASQFVFLVGCTAEIVLCSRHIRREADRRYAPPRASGGQPPLGRAG